MAAFGPVALVSGKRRPWRCIIRTPLVVDVCLALLLQATVQHRADPAVVIGQPGRVGRIESSLKAIFRGRPLAVWLQQSKVLKANSVADSVDALWDLARSIQILGLRGSFSCHQSTGSFLKTWPKGLPGKGIGLGPWPEQTAHRA